MIRSFLRLRRCCRLAAMILLLSVAGVSVVKAQGDDRALTVVNPKISNVYVDEITSTTATLHATVKAGDATTYLKFRFGTSTSYGEELGLFAINANQTSTFEYEVDGLSPNTTYHFMARALALNGGYADGSDYSFTTDSPTGNEPPVQPYNPNPADGATNISLNPTLSWSCYSPSSDIDYYELYVRTPDYSYEHYFYPTQSYKTIPLSATLSPSQKYYWKVKAFDTEGLSTQGPLWEFTTESAGCFDDCTSSDCGNLGQQMYTAAQYLCERGIVEGSNGYLNPDDDITRAQLAKTAFFGLYNGQSNVPNSIVTDYFPSIYPDLQNPNAYYYQAAKALLYLEYGDGRSPFDRDRAVFNPTGTISRCLVLKVLLETFNIAPATGGSNPFSDYDSSEQFWGYAKKAYDLGIVQVTNFNPHANCTRGQVFLYIYRILTNNNIPKPTPNYDSNDPLSSDFFVPTNLSAEVVNAMRGVEYGNFNFYQKNFFEIPGYMDLDFGISYNSYLTEMPDDIYPVKPLGKAWTHNYDMYMNIVTDEYDNKSYYVFHMQSGSLLIYKQDLTKATQGDYSTLTTSGSNKFILKAPDQTVYTFQRFNSNDDIFYLVKINDRNNNAINIEYENQVEHYRVKTVSTQGRSLSFYYKSGTDLVYYVKDPMNRKVYFYYTNAELTSIKDAKSQTTSFEYGTMDFEKGLLKRIVLPLGNEVYNNYQQRKLTSTQYNNDIPTTVNITPSYQSGNTTSVVTQPISNGQSATVTYSINGSNRVTRIQDDQYTDVSYAYGDSDHPALVSSMVDNKKNIQTNYTYNSSGLITKKRISAGGQTITIQSSFNDQNDIESYTDPNGNTTHFEYDNNGNLTKIIDAMNHSTTMVNNSHGVPTQITDVNGNAITFQYNSYGNIQQVSIPSLNLNNTMAFDDVSRTVSITDYAGHQTTYTYDNNDNVLAVTDALNNTTTYTFDSNDNLTQITNALDKSTNMTYDNNDFLSSVSFQGYTKSFTYNKNGSLKSYTTPNGHTFNYTYSDAGDLTSNGYATFSYDNKGQLASVTKDGKAITYTYDAFSRPVSVTYDGMTVSYTYDNNSNVKTIVYPGNKTVTYTYDALNRITSVKDWNNATTSYSYRNDGLISYYQYPNQVRTTYSYDNAGRCLGVSTKRGSGNGSVIAQYSFELDNMGNHISESVTEPFAEYPFFPMVDENYNYNAANRLTSAGGLTFDYDNNGNNTSRTGRDFGYDDRNNLTSVSGDFTASYTYDGYGNRRSATRNGQIRKYVLNPLGNASVLMETDGSGNVLYYYVYGPSGLISRISASNETRYYVYDYRGSTVAMTDASSSANITHKYQYDDFGKLLQVEEADENLFRFVGKFGVTYEDEDLAFMRARYYNPTIGRFLSEDPVWSTYLYAYADNNPITGIDPDGRLTKDDTKQIINDIVTNVSSTAGQMQTAAGYAKNGGTFKQVMVDLGSDIAGMVSSLFGPVIYETKMIIDYADALISEVDEKNRLALATQELSEKQLVQAKRNRNAERDKIMNYLITCDFSKQDSFFMKLWSQHAKAAAQLPEREREERYNLIYKNILENKNAYVEH
ncbi:MAG: S-layer homology domain-containing protein [Bacteroidales bacterium]|nr:S-layer homology domain-containing protein [Bacteroidales bacterium]